MKVALVLTPFDQLEAMGFRSRKTGTVYGYSMPLGIAYLAAVLENAGIEVAVLDPCPQQLSASDVAAWVGRQRPDVLGISALTHVARAAYRVAREVKKELPQLPVIMGGSHCTVFPEKVLDESPHIDVVVIGEAEQRILPLVKALIEGSSLADIPGLIFRDSKGVPSRYSAPVVQTDLNAIPFPARHLFNHKVYVPFPDQIRLRPVTNLISSRGCTWRKCKFCFEGGRFMPHYRHRSPENVVEELILVKQQGFNGVSFWDDNFCISEKWISSFCKLLRDAKLNLSWTCYGRVDTLTEQMVWDIKSAGCFSIYFGFESGNQKVLDFINKGTTLEQARRAVAVCHSAGIEVRGSFIMGMPGDTPELAQQTIRFARELDMDSVKFMLYTPEPGTQLYDIAAQDGTIIDKGFQGSLAKATYIPRGYQSSAQLETIALKANRAYMLRAGFILKKLRTVRNWRDLRKYIDGFFLMLSLRRS